MSWGAVAGATIGAVGSYMGSKGGGGGSQQSSNAPWGVQAPYLDYGFGQTKDALNNALAMGTYGGPRVAGLDPMQTQGANYAGTYANGYGMPGAQALGSTAIGNVNAGANFGSNAAGLYAQVNGADPTQQIIKNANAYANNPSVDGLIDSANRDVTRQLNEQDLPSLARAASGSGNTNSTRTGTESAILQRGASDRMADTASNIRSQFFGKGLDMAQGQYNQNLSNSLNANSQLLQAYQAGGNGVLQGQQAAGNTMDQLLAGGGLFQTQNQAGITAGQQAFQEKQNGALDLLGKYQSIIGGNYGGTSSSSSSSGSNPWASALQGGLGGASAGAGLFGKLGGYSTTPTTSGGSWGTQGLDKFFYGNGSSGD